MGDSKKRAAGRELSRDNPGLDDEEEVPGQETGTFKRASDEVLANRRIVKVKRSQPSSTPSSNPFAAIRLVPPTVPTPVPEPVNDSEKSGKPASENAESPESVNKKDGKQSENEVVENDENAPVVEKERDQNEGELAENDENTPAAEKEKDGLVKNDESTPVAEKEKDENKDGSDKKDENTPVADENKDELEKTDDNTPAPASVNSFGQLSSNQNAFTGLAGTGFSSSAFSFGSIPKTDTPTFPSFSFGTNGNSSLFGNPGKTEGGTKAQPSMQEVQVETGEENERVVFTADSILFEFLEGGWKERGKGELKVNVLTSGSQKARLVMRARGNYRLILNASIFPDMKLTNMEKKGITFACLNSTGEEGQNSLSTFALKFKDPLVVDEFRSVVMEHKDKTGAAAPTLKTPENSPKASDE